MKENKKKEKKDFTSDMLPKNRAYQFFDVSKNNWRTLLLLGLFFLIGLLPYLVSFLVEYGYIEGTSKYLLEQGLSKEEVALKMNTIHQIFNGINIVCYMIFSLFLAGSAQIIKELCFGEGVLFKSDYLKGIKQNYKSFLLISFLAGLLLFIVQYVTSYFSLISKQNSGYAILNGVTLGIYFAIFVPLFLFYLSQSSIYVMPVGKNFQNSFRLSIVKYYYVIIFAAALFGLYSLLYIANPVIMLVCLGLIFLLVLPYFVLAFHLYSLSLFDRYINQDHYKEIYRKGLSN